MASGPPILKLLVLSDIHFGSLACSRDFALTGQPLPHLPTSSVPMKQSLLDVLSDISINAILVPGDLTSTGTPSEFAECHAVLHDVARKLKVAPTNMFLTYGNHDVDWRIAGLGKTISPPDPRYQQAAVLVGPGLAPPTDPDIKGPVEGSGVFHRDSFTLYSLHTAIESSGSEQYHHGKLGNEQLQWFQEQLESTQPHNAWQILMMHHHPVNYPYPTPTPDISTLEEGADLIEIIGMSTIDIVCHGHRHQPKLLTRLDTSWSSPKTFVCAGSLAVNSDHRQNGEFQNTFHIIDLERRDNNHSAIGTLHTFGYNSRDGWIPHKYSSSVPLDAIQSFGIVSSGDERKNLICNLLNNGLKPPGSSRLLPLYPDLPTPLRCVSCQQLNKEIDAVVQDIGTIKLVGRYPDEVAIWSVE